VWQPPARLAYLWYLGRDRADATEVEIRFLARGTDATWVEIAHRGWERLGPETAQPWRTGIRPAGRPCYPHFIKAITHGEALNGRRHEGRPVGAEGPLGPPPATPCTRTGRPIRLRWSARSASTTLKYRLRAIEDLARLAEGPGRLGPAGRAR